MKLPANEIIGDLDSVSNQALKYHSKMGAKIFQFPTDKDQTDFELALRGLSRNASREVHITGLFGGRFDHEIMNLCTLSVFSEKGLFTFDFRDGCAGISGPGNLALWARAESKTALISFAPQISGLTSEGVRWPLKNASLEFGESRGISNSIKKPPWKISFQSGTLLWIIFGVFREELEIEWLPSKL